MPRIDRKIKRERARALKARTKREQEMINRAYDLGVGMGIEFQKQKLNYSTLGMGYLYEYSVEGTPEQPTVIDSNVGADVRVTELDGGIDFVEQVRPTYDYPDADSIPA